MIRLLIVAMLGLNGCGSSKDSSGCQEKTEIDSLAISSQTFGSLGSDIDVTATLKDQCPNVQYSGIYALKEISEPANCTDGDSKVSGSSVSWTGLKANTLYFIRGCATTPGYTSPGTTKSVTTPAAS